MERFLEGLGQRKLAHPALACTAAAFALFHIIDVAQRFGWSEWQMKAHPAP